MTIGKRIWTSQPQGAVGVDWGNPLSSKLVFGFNAAADPVELVRGVAATPGSGGYTKGVGRYGRRLSGVSAVEGNAQWYGYSTGAEYTIANVLLDNTGRGVVRHPCSADDQSNLRVCQIRLETTNAVEMIPFNTAGTAYTFSGTLATSDSDLSVIVGSVNSAKLAQVYLNGVANGSRTVSGTPRGLVATSRFTIGNYVGSSNAPFLGDVYATFVWDRCLSDAEIAEFSLNPWQLFAPRREPIWVGITAPTATVALTGTATTATEADIVTGGKTIILTLTNDTWVASGATFDAQRQNIINGLDSDLSEGTGWDAVVKATQGVGGVVRTSDTVVTITLDAFATYDITADETITATVPATALTAASALVASPAFQVTYVAAGGFQAAWARGSNAIIQVGL